MKKKLLFKRKKTFPNLYPLSTWKNWESLNYKQDGALGDLSGDLLSKGHCGCHGDGCLQHKPSCASIYVSDHLAFSAMLLNLGSQTQY